MLLGVMAARGEVAMSGTERREKLWDLAARVYPDAPVVPSARARRIRDERRLRALGIARPRARERPGEPDDVGDAGEPAVVEGVRGVWRVDPAALGQPFEGAGVLRVTALHEDVALTAAARADVRREIEDLARWLELDLVTAG